MKGLQRQSRQLSHIDLDKYETELKRQQNWVEEMLKLCAPSKCHKDIFKLQRVRHFGPLDADVIRISVLRLVVEPARQRDGATAVRHHFTWSRLHDHCSSVVLCQGKKKERGLHSR